MKQKVRIFRWTVPLWPILASLCVVGGTLAVFLFAIVREPATFTKAGISLTPISGWPVDWGILMPGVETYSEPIAFQVQKDTDVRIWMEFSDPNGLCPDAAGEFTVSLSGSQYPVETALGNLRISEDLCSLVPGSATASIPMVYGFPSPQTEDGQFTFWMSIISHNSEGGHLDGAFDIAVIAAELGQIPNACGAGFTGADVFPQCDIEE